MSIDWIATTICDVLEEQHGKGYANEKRKRLSGVDRFGVLIWMNELDNDNLQRVAKKLNVDLDGHDFVRKFVRQL